MNSVQIHKIHFINRIDDINIGDWLCSPMNWFFYYFNNYNIIRHDMGWIQWNQIAKTDVVIIGGGGMLYNSNAGNENINRMLGLCDTVIGWSVGFNSLFPPHQWNGVVDNEISLEKFRLIGIRDFNHKSGLEWLPCPSCFAFEWQKKRETVRKFGIIEHRSIPIEGLPYDKITNACSAEQISDFIASTGVIITNSYHMVYFSQLMGKKVICVNPFSTKFNWFKYKPVFYNGGLNEDLMDGLVKQASCCEGALEESRKLNLCFFERVKMIIEERIPEKNNDYGKVWLLNQQCLWREYDFMDGSSRDIAWFKTELERIDAQTRISNILFRLLCAPLTLFRILFKRYLSPAEK